MAGVGHKAAVSALVRPVRTRRASPPGSRHGGEHPPRAAGPGRVRHPGLHHPGQVPQHVEELGVVQPHGGDVVADPVVHRVDAVPGDVAVEVAEQPRDKGQERLPVVVDVIESTSSG